MEKSWNIINLPRVMEFCFQSWNFTHFAPELYGTRLVDVFCHNYWFYIIRNKDRGRLDLDLQGWIQQISIGAGGGGRTIVTIFGTVPLCTPPPPRRLNASKSVPA